MIATRVEALDTGLFRHVPTETTEDDQRSLLAIHDTIARRTGTFSYLEIGSHLGGTLQVLIADPRCVRMVSIDPRPASQPDDRGRGFDYPDNSTDRMLALLRGVPDADLDKLQTVEMSTEDIAPGGFPRPDLCFIDGEHTYAAALRDARFCRAVLQGAGVVAFHDAHIVEPAIRDFLREASRPYRAYPLMTSHFVVELGAGRSLFDSRAVRSQLGAPQRAWISANRMAAADKLLTLRMLARRALR
jgi:hypothetical protein